MVGFAWKEGNIVTNIFIAHFIGVTYPNIYVSQKGEDKLFLHAVFFANMFEERSGGRGVVN